MNNEKLRDLLKRNNINDDDFLNEAYESLLISVFESIASQMDSDNKFKMDVRNRYRNSENVILTTKNLIYESTKCDVSNQESKKIYDLIYAYFTKKGNRELNNNFKNKLMLTQKNKCNICKKDITNEFSEVDHKIPWSLVGDELGEGNLQLLCRDCNRKKSKNSAYNLKLFLVNK